MTERARERWCEGGDRCQREGRNAIGFATTTCIILILLHSYTVSSHAHPQVLRTPTAPPSSPLPDPSLHTFTPKSPTHFAHSNISRRSQHTSVAWTRAATAPVEASRFSPSQRKRKNSKRRFKTRECFSPVFCTVLMDFRSLVFSAFSMR